MDEKEIIDLLLFLRNANQEDAEHFREDISRREAMFSALVEKFVARMKKTIELRLEQTFDDPRRAIGR